VKRPVPKAQVDAYGPAIPQLAARAMRYARVLRIGRGHRGALVTRAETSPLEQGNEILLSVEPDRLGQRERERKREREREKKRERERETEREREAVSQSVPFFFLRTTHRRPRESTESQRAAGTKGTGCVQV
jgi:hypothetical protein